MTSRAMELRFENKRIVIMWYEYNVVPQNEKIHVGLPVV